MVAERGEGNPDGGPGNTGSGENVPVPPGSPNNPGVPGDAPQAMNMGTGTSGYAGPPLSRWTRITDLRDSGIRKLKDRGGGIGEPCSEIIHHLQKGRMI